MSQKAASRGESQSRNLPQSSGVLLRKCDKCRKKKPALQRASVRSEHAQAPPIVHEVLRSAGAPLDHSTRDFMEPRMGQDFSQVRVHTDAKAAESARAVNALAYTVGRDVVFGMGQYTPGTNNGRQLLAHELVHIVQQSKEQFTGVQMEGSLEVNDPADSYEQEAEIQAALVLEDRRLDGRTIAPAIMRGVPPGTSRLQRKAEADINQAPADLPCVLSTGPGHTPGIDVLFGVSSSTLTASQKADVAAFVSAWIADGSSDEVIVDGWASVDGPQPLNWQLSCDRAETVKSELIAQGVSASKILTIAHGESTEFSTTDLASNRRAIITRLPGVKAGPASITPAPPATAPPGSRPLSFVTIKRNNIKFSPKVGTDYGHWWTEINSDESYGWWPDHCPVTLRETLFGTGGDLNGVKGCGGKPTEDPHHGETADEVFKPILTVPKTDDQVRSEIRSFSKSYSGGWRWTFGFGQNCRTFQKSLMDKVGLRRP